MIAHSTLRDGGRTKVLTALLQRGWMEPAVAEGVQNFV